jgi:hypothetical protein
MTQYDGEIHDLQGALTALNGLAKDFYPVESWPYHQFPFGLWFRGHPRLDLDLRPRVFRETLVNIPKDGTWDEANVFDHLRLRDPQHERTYHSAFDWLCLMQHYSIPTRLLDWSESIVVGLYFAVKADAEVDGELIVLNARRLNRQTKPRPTISTPESGHVAVRAEMAVKRSARKLKRSRAVMDALHEDPDLDPNDWIEHCRRPTAVFPRRLNDRMKLQSSVFTLHGGKMYVPGLEAYYRGDLIPSPISLEQIDKHADILKRYVIPTKKKETIRRDLLMLGIHEGMLFPEVDHQEAYLKELWWFQSQ